MRLHLPSLLLTAILATFPSFTASAAVVGTGVSYDNGKGSYPYSKNPEAHDMGQYEESGDPKTDGLLCWANSAANMIQYWQDNYSNYLTNAAPNGFNTDQDGSFKYGQPKGTRYLDVYEKFLEYSKVDDADYQRKALDWYFLNPSDESVSSLLGKRPDTDKYVNSVFDGMTKSYREDDFSFSSDLKRLTDVLQDVFSVRGQAVGLQVFQLDTNDDWDNSRYHAITCWGFETKDNLVSAMYLSDSDDQEFGVFKVDVALGQYIAYEGEEPIDAMVLRTNDDTEGYGGSFVVYLMGLESIATPSEDYAKQASDYPVPYLQGETLLTENTLVGTVSRTGAGVQVGDGSNIVMLVPKDENSSLSLKAEGATGTGLDVKEGSLASVANLDVSGYERGVNAEGKVYLFGESVNVHGNALLDAHNGAGIRNANYLEIKDSGYVVISENFTEGKGAGICNEGVLSISDNEAVVFFGNMAVGGGNDIYNAKGASLNIADNGSVIFSGMYYTDTAVVNEGEMYVKSGLEPAGVEFRDSSLDSSQGTTYLGRDINGNTSATTVTFTVTDWESEIPTDLARLEITGGQGGIAAELEHLTVDAYSIMGAGGSGGVVSNALITSLGGMTMSDLQLDTTDSVNTLGSGFTHLDNVVLTLTNDDMVDNTFDLTSVLTGNLTLDKVVFDLSSTTLTGDALKDITFNLSKAYAEEQKRDISFKTATTTYTLAEAGSTVLFAAAPLPEPTTGTLSLLALAGLAARRRK